MLAEAAAIPPNPKTPAMMARMKNSMLQPNMIGSFRPTCH
jgi:hypothetical protein